MTQAVCSYAPDVAPLVDGAVKIDEVMIADGVESAGAVPTVYVGYGYVTSARCGGAMDDDFRDVSHDVVRLTVTKLRPSPP